MFGVSYTAISTDTDETINDITSPAEFVSAVSKRKADNGLLVIEPCIDKIIIAADTVVSFNDIILGKPIDKSEAKYMLNMLNNEWHEVYTGITLTDGNKYITDTELTKVKFRQLDEWEIDNYIKKYNPIDKAGAYGIQEGAGLFVERIEGDYYNVMGLPMCKLSVMLRNFDIYI